MLALKQNEQSSDVLPEHGQLALRIRHSHIQGIDGAAEAYLFRAVHCNRPSSVRPGARRPGIFLAKCGNRRPYVAARRHNGVESEQIERSRYSPRKSDHDQVSTELLDIGNLANDKPKARRFGK
jgi:hypothetical protein